MQMQDVPQLAQSFQCRKVIFQSVLGLSDRRLESDKTAGNRAQGPHRPSVIGIASVDGRLKRSGVYDDCSSRRDDGGLFH